MGNALEFAARVIATAQALLKAGQDAAGVLETGGKAITVMQAENRDPNEQEWDAIHAYRHELETAAKS